MPAPGRAETYGEQDHLGFQVGEFGDLGTQVGEFGEYLLPDRAVALQSRVCPVPGRSEPCRAPRPLGWRIGSVGA